MSNETKSNGMQLRFLLPHTLRPRLINGILFVALAGLAAWKFGVAAQDRHGTLRLSIVDGVSGQPTTARVEVLDVGGTAYIATDALLVGPGYGGRANPWEGNLDRALALLSGSVANPYTRTTQFYSTGQSRLSLPAGAYQLRLYKGTEYKVQAREVKIDAQKSVDFQVEMSRWINMPEQGWYSADDHLHISRPLKELNPLISKWMQAEDIHVANLLQFGSWNRFYASPQYQHGQQGLYREGDYLLAAGQENPRTHFLGHTIILGQQSRIHFPEQYVIYKHFWEEARRQGALSGYAHWGTGSGALTGLAIDLHSGLLNFLEVLEAHDANYEVWYDILNTGFRLTPTAGTDYGSVPCLPGRERFYTNVKGPFTYKSWLEGIRSGRTFVTNGPVLDFRVQGKGMGEEVVLEEPGSVLVEARLRFDPERDDVKRLEVIRNGDVLRSFPRVDPSGEIRVKFEWEIGETSWLALRASGSKLGEETPAEGLIPPYRDRYRGAYASHAHSAPIFVTIKNAPSLSQHPRAKALAQAWIARLEELEMRLADDKVQYLSQKTGGDIPRAEHIRENRAGLLDALGKAKRHFSQQSR